MWSNSSLPSLLSFVFSSHILVSFFSFFRRSRFCLSFVVLPFHPPFYPPVFVWRPNYPSDACRILECKDRTKEVDELIAQKASPLMPHVKLEVDPNYNNHPYVYYVHYLECTLLRFRHPFLTLFSFTLLLFFLRLYSHLPFSLRLVSLPPLSPSSSSSSTLSPSSSSSSLSLLLFLLSLPLCPSPDLVLTTVRDHTDNRRMDEWVTRDRMVFREEIDQMVTAVEEEEEEVAPQQAKVRCSLLRSFLLWVV